LFWNWYQKEGINAFLEKRKVEGFKNR